MLPVLAAELLVARRQKDQVGNDFALPSFCLRTKLDEPSLFVRYRNGLSSSLVPCHIGVRRNLHRKYMGIQKNTLH